MNLTTLEYWLINVVLVGLATFLGKVWATRIATKEQAKLDQELERIKQDFSSQQDNVKHTQSLVNHALQNSLNSNSMIDQKRYDAIYMLWNNWLEADSEISKFLFPYGLMLKENIQNDDEFKKMFPYDQAVMGETMKSYMKKMHDIQKELPYLPVRIYQFYKIISTVFGRHAVNVQSSLADSRFKRSESWHLNDKGEIEEPFQALLDYIKENKIQAPSTTYHLEWQHFFKEHLLQLIHEYFEGTLDRNINVFEKANSLEISKSDKIEEQ